ncbi:MAG: response regulator [Patescibacteria group bacterium]
MLEPKPPQPGQNQAEGKERLKKRILFAEDDENNRKYITRFLLREGYEVETVKNGQELLEKLATEEFDAVIADNTMPVMSGIEALKKIRENARFKNLPVIIQSGYEEIKETVERLGGIFIQKPFSFDEFKKEVEKALE